MNKVIFPSELFSKYAKKRYYDSQNIEKELIKIHSIFTPFLRRLGISDTIVLFETI